MSRSTSLSWGDSAIDLVLPKPKVPSVLLIDQHRNEFQGALLRMVANDLSESIPVHWIDGGMAFDPSPLLPLLRIRGCKNREVLSNFHICRGFTAHQTASIIQRLSNEAISKNSPNRMIEGRIIVISQIPRMFMDTQLKKSEGRSLLKATLQRCRDISKDSNSLVILTSSRNSSPPLRKDMCEILRQFTDDILRVDESRSKKSNRGLARKRLHLLSLDREMIWTQLPFGQTSLLEFRHIQTSRLDCSFEPAATTSSFQPKGDSIEVAARTASGV